MTHLDMLGHIGKSGSGMLLDSARQSQFGEYQPREGSFKKTQRLMTEDAIINEQKNESSSKSNVTDEYSFEALEKLVHSNHHSTKKS